MRLHRLLRSITVLFIVIISIGLFSKLAFAQEGPTLPDFFYGKATVNCKSVPLNSYVIAKIDNVKRGQIKVTVAGLYGNKDTDNKLAVSGGRSTIGRDIEFFVKLPKLQEIKATQTASWESGSINGLDLTFVGAEIPDNSTDETLAEEVNSTKESYFFKALVAGKQLTISLSNPNIPITKLQLIVNRNVTNVTFEFETVDILNLPKNIPKLEGVYKYISINAPKVEQSFVQTAILKFQVPNGWLKENNYDPTTVKLLRYYNNTWNELVTYHEGDDATDNYYRAVTPGFSYFAIKAEKLKQEANAMQLEAPKEQEKTKTASEEQKETPQVVNQLTTYVVEKVKTSPIIFVVLVLVGMLVGILATYYFVIRKQE